MTKITEMKKVFYCIILMIITLGNNLMAQEEQEMSEEEKERIAEIRKTSTTYALALRYNDANVAKNALYDLLTDYPQNDSLLYSLSLLYLQSQQFASAALSSQDLIARNPEHLAGLEVNGIAYDNLGVYDKALSSYESLYLKTEDLNILYKMTFIQFRLQRYTESMTNIDILMSKEEAEEMKAVFPSDQNQQKEFPIKVALLNLKGLIHQEKGDKENAKKFFNEALAMAPDFVAAKQNIEQLDKE